MADPIALAALSRSEATMAQRIRISGLGGEVARGFYYLGRVGQRPVTRGRSDRLASWRMFANEHSDAPALHSAFRSWAPQFALDEVYRLMDDASEDWFTATDEFYLWQRMQRWAGVTDTAVGRDREIVNPMLDSRFVNLARALPPADKKKSRYLGRIQVALDPTLAQIRLDGRPAPVAFAYPGLRAQAQMATATGQKALKKVRQRLRKGTRPPAGGLAFAPLVVKHWRTEPALLEPLGVTGVFDPEWLERVTAGDSEPSPATVSLMVNLLGALS
jgi:asparagine synthase (glutamine-hydrolysing)